MKLLLILFLILLVVWYTLRAETYPGINFRVFLVIIAKVSVFGNSESSKRKSFSTRNHRYFLKREIRKLFKNSLNKKKQHKNREIQKY